MRPFKEIYGYLSTKLEYINILRYPVSDTSFINLNCGGLWFYANGKI